MGREDIDRMIADALDAAEEPRRGARPLPHGQHILDQYAALCRAGEPQGPDPSAEVALRVTPAGGGTPAPRTYWWSSIARRLLARVKR